MNISVKVNEILKIEKKPWHWLFKKYVLVGESEVCPECFINGFF